MSSTCPNGHLSTAEDYCDTCGAPMATAASAAPPASTDSPASSEEPGQAAEAAQTLGPAEAPVGSGSGTGGAEAPASPAGQPTDGHLCPNCGVDNGEGALFCEACGYDFTTGAMPRGTQTASSALSTEGSAGAGISPSSAQNLPGEPAFEWVAEVWIDPDWYRTQEADDPCPSPGLPVIVPLRHKSVLLGRVSASKNTHPEVELSSDPGVSRRHAQLTTDGTRWFVEDLGSSNGTFVGPASGSLPAQPIPVGPKTELSDDDRLYVGAWTRVVVRRATPEEAETFD